MSDCFEKIANLIMTVNIKAAEDGTLLMPLPAGLGTKRWIEVSPLFFREVGGQGYLIFFDDARGRITHAFMDETFTVVKRLKWFDVPMFHYLLDDRPEEPVLPLESALILGQEALEVMKEDPVEDGAFWMSGTIDSCHSKES